MTAKEYQEEAARLVNAANNLANDTLHLKCQMNLDNPTPINKAAYRAITLAVKRTMSAAEALQSAGAYRYDPGGKKPKEKHCATCAHYLKCKYKTGECDAWEPA